MKHLAKSFLFLGLIPAILCCAISRESGVKTPDEIEPADTIRYADNGNIYEYEMVEEIDLGEGVIKVWFGKDGEYPRLVIYDREFRKFTLISFPTADFNKENKKENKIEKGRFSISPNAEYIGLTKVVEYSEYEPTKMKFVLLDKDGNEIWGKEYPTGYESGGAVYYVSDKGAVAEYSGKTLTFYDSKGNIVKEVELLYSRMVIESGINSGYFSEDGNYLVINVKDPEKEIFSTGTGVILFNNRGEELWRFRTEEESAGRLYISSEGKHIIAASHNWGRDEEGVDGLIKRTTYLLDRAGHLIRKYSNLISANGTFSSSGNYAIVCDTKEGTTYLLDTKTGDRLFKFSLRGTGRGRHVNNACIAESAKLIGITYSNTIELIQFNGVKAWSHKVSNPKYLWVSDDGSKITVRSENKILRFEKVN